MESWLNQPFDADTIPAGPETDWRLLHHVLDWKRGVASLGQQPYVYRGGGDTLMWPVSADAAYAERAADALRARGFTVETAPEAGGFLTTIRGPGGAIEARAETAALAFARSALKGMLAGLIVKR